MKMLMTTTMLMVMKSRALMNTMRCWLVPKREWHPQEL